jgi:phosphatidylglycerol lysyltransferase
MKAIPSITIKSIQPKLYWREVLAILMMLIAIFFFRSERKELGDILPNLRQANPLWLLVSLLFTFATMIFQGGMYRKSFAAIGLSLYWVYAVVLFLKRNLVSVFLPAGGISSLAYSPSQLRKSGFNKLQVHQASGLFAFAGLLTVFLAGLPVILFIFFSGSEFKNSLTSLSAIMILIVLIYTSARSLTQKGWLYHLLGKIAPSHLPSIHELFNANANLKIFSSAILYSLGVELCGMLQVYFAMLALGLSPSFEAAAAAYIISIAMMVVSPFLRGLGAVELSMVYVLGQFGYSPLHALSVTVLYRVFEFWLPLLLGLFAFAWKGKNLFLRLAPALLIFSLGLINIISVITPPIHHRLQLLRGYIPLTAIHASNALVLFTGFTLLLTSALLFRGLRNAWMVAVFLSIFSLIGHLGKALDYEEAIFAALVFIVLVNTSSGYTERSSPKHVKAGLKTVVLIFAAVLIFGFISFYFIDVRHFGQNFNLIQSLLHTLKSFLLIEDASLNPVTRFGMEFIWLLRILGFITWSFLLLALFRPHIKKTVINESQQARAMDLLKQFGNSANDYFKVCKDKLFFFSEECDAFIAYRIAGGFAIVLEEPVCDEENKITVLIEFDRHCQEMGLKPSFYRVDENSIPWFDQLKKQKIIIGQEAILDINRFSLEGKEKKSLRNGLNSLQKKGYTVCIHPAPQPRSFIKELKMVSDEWLKNFDVKEIVFSQGMFDENELQLQDIITLKDAEGNIKAFLNILPGFVEDECTYDMIRKTNDAPAAAMDALIVKLIEYARGKKLLYLDLGMVPMAGINQPGNTAEFIIKLAAAKIKRFQHYKGLKEFKAKYATLWENKYLVYDNDYDLLQLPLALNKVMKP